ncbi:MAG: hypothetical protein GY796_27555 [Chloroflexi bacterium]|nr:hypothetical protein [Chloroflexota bacterium]
MFQKIRNREDTTDVLIEVLDHEDPDMWPATDTIWIITNSSIEKVETWFDERFTPDEIYEGWDDRYPRELYMIPDRLKVIGLWWD